MYRSQFITHYYNQQTHNQYHNNTHHNSLFAQSTLLHVSTLSCPHQTVYKQRLAKLQTLFKLQLYPWCTKHQHASNQEHTTNVVIQQNSRKLLMIGT